MQMKRIAKSAAWLLSVMVLLLTCTTGLAIEQIDTSKTVKLTVSVQEEDKTTKDEYVPLPGMELKLYRIADVNEDAEYTLTAAFAPSKLVVNEMKTAEDMKAAAEMLSGIIAKDTSIAPEKAAKSGKDGLLTFQGMKPGLFLVLGNRQTIDGYVYDFQPAMIALPEKPDSDEHKAWAYELAIEAKLQRYEQLMKLTVIKQWESENGDYSHEPNELLVDLLCDGEVYGAPLHLNEENGWKVTVENLSMIHTWTVSEHRFRGSDQYEVEYGTVKKVEEGSYSITITNTYKAPTPPKVPQTGLLWWPVPVLAGLGIVLFATGWFMRRKARS